MQLRNFNRHISLASAVIGIAVGFPIILCGCGRSPSDQELVRQFEEHKAAYDRLRDLLVADANLRNVAPSGVQMADSPIYVMPPTPRVSSAKYQEYMGLLKSVGATRASRSEGPHPGICIGVSAGGWAGDTRHKNVCWRESPLAKNGRFSDKLIERYWYLEEN
jgi:hypothetical protein